MTYSSFVKNYYQKITQLNVLKYFPARVKPLGDDDRPNRQRIYWNAVKHTYGNQFEIIEGKFIVKNKKFRKSAHQWDTPSTATQESVLVMKSEEKGSDVNLAINLIIDAYENKYEEALVISNDTDLTNAIRYTKKILKKKIYIVNPHILVDSGVHIKLKIASTKILTYDKSILSKCQLPEKIEGTRYRKPPLWNNSGSRC